MDAIVVGAGVAGLACARDLRAAGLNVVVVEKSRGLGGRCATRRLDGQPVDHGLPFFHGDDSPFREALLDAASGRWLDGWPGRIVGRGRPCRSSAFREGSWRGAIRTGVNDFPKALAAGLEIRREFRVVRVEGEEGGFAVRDADGRIIRARSVVVALPATQAGGLLEASPLRSEELPAVIEVLRMVAMTRCLTVIADYGVNTPAPETDLWLPEDSDRIQQIVLDSAKRDRAARTILVIQAGARWSTRHWGDPTESWVRCLLDDAAFRVGDWASRPQATQFQRWRFARTDGASEFPAPMLLRMGNAGMMGVTGEAFSPGGGVQGAWRAGRTMARRLLDEGA